jgi:hypothetical protein
VGRQGEGRGVAIDGGFPTVPALRRGGEQRRDKRRERRCRSCGGSCQTIQQRGRRFRHARLPIADKRREGEECRTPAERGGQSIVRGGTPLLSRLLFVLRRQIVRSIRTRRALRRGPAGVVGGHALRRGADRVARDPPPPRDRGEKGNLAPDTRGLPVLPGGLRPRRPLRTAAGRRRLLLPRGRGGGGGGIRDPALEGLEHAPVPRVREPDNEGRGVQPREVWPVSRRVLLGLHAVPHPLPSVPVLQRGALRKCVRGRRRRVRREGRARRPREGTASGTDADGADRSSRGPGAAKPEFPPIPLCVDGWHSRNFVGLRGESRVSRH